MTGTNMTSVTKTLELSEREITYLYLGLKHFEEKLFATMGETVGDEMDDLLMVQWLQKKLVALKDKPPTAADNGEKNNHDD